MSITVTAVTLINIVYNMDYNVQYSALVITRREQETHTDKVTLLVSSAHRTVLRVRS